MHRIDQIELRETLSQLRREADSLAAEVTDEERLLRLRRIVVLLDYMTEHLAMMRAEPRIPAALEEHSP